MPSAIHQLLLQTVQQLALLPCHYCRLIYGAEAITLEAMLATEGIEEASRGGDWAFQGIRRRSQALQGRFEWDLDAESAMAQMLLQLPLLEPDELTSPLSEREQEVLGLLAQGDRDRDIAERLYISERTVKFHVKNILAKSQVKTRVQAVYQATKQGWIG